MDKGKVMQVLDGMSDEVDVEALVEKLYLLKKIDDAERQLSAGQGVSHEEAKRRLAPWLN